MSASRQLKPGLKLTSAACSAQVIVIRAPAVPVTITCCGQPLVTEGEPRPAAGEPDAVLIGKRYTDEPSGLELLCTRSGAGPLAADGRELTVKAAKPLPSSD